MGIRRRGAILSRMASPLEPSEMMDCEQLFGVRDPVALVTGSGAPRVGRVILEALAAAGFRSVVHANSSRDAAESLVEELRRRHARPAAVVVGDLRDESVVASVFEQIDEEFGRLDVLVNSAAIWESKPLEEVVAEDVRRHFEINALGTFLCCQAAGRRMQRQPHGGAIVNIGDWATVRPYLNYAAYFPSKGAVETITRNLAVELAERNPRIRVNAVLPGPVMLPNDLPPEEKQAAINATLVKREGSPDNVAQAVLALVGNDFITGACLPVDGGRSIYAP